MDNEIKWLNVYDKSIFSNINRFSSKIAPFFFSNDEKSMKISKTTLTTL